MARREKEWVCQEQKGALEKGKGVTTIAGGKSTVAGYRDGPSEDAKFSNDFDVIYVRPTCSLLVIDRGNAALRQISLEQEDCDSQSSSVSSTDILTVVGAIILGYATCMLQQGFGPSFFSKTRPSEGEFKAEIKAQASHEKTMPILENSKEEPGWPSFGQLLVDLSKLSLEALAGAFTQFIPSRLKSNGPARGLTPLKDRLKMPEDEVQQPPLVNRQSAPAPVPLTGIRHHAPPTETRHPAPPIETRQVHTPSTAEKHSEMKPRKIKSSSSKDPSLSSSKHHSSSKRAEYAEFYGSTEIPPYTKSKVPKERPRHRSREKSGEVVYGAVKAEPKPAETRTVDYSNPKFDHYSMRTKYASGEAFRFNTQ
ncbi:hypothetical protein PIB30_026346 [Stylosanthes scabra]|uniref:Uncharacterized protein n=1 Tax=Stylosanthes scabra TaxID=79078 RepID=A0ABU6Y8Z1_9FABA|nr:hypothetical protein [Stylosanthes scabra]